MVWVQGDRFLFRVMVEMLKRLQDLHVEYAQDVVKKLPLIPNNCYCESRYTFWTEDQFVVTTSSGIWDHDTRVVEIVTRELQKTKPGKWGCVQVHDLWSPEEETHVCPAHH